MGTNLREALVAKGLGKKTVAGYLAVMWDAERFCEERGTTLRAAPPTVVAAFAETKPYTWSSQKLVRTAFMHYWEATGRRNPPLAAVRVPPKPDMECRAIEPDDATILAKAARHRGDAKGLAVLLALYLALRRTEIATLRWDNFDADFRWCRLIGKLGRQGKLPVHPILREALAAANHEHPVWIFPGRLRKRPGPVHPATIWHWVREVTDDAGIGLVPPHPLRHTCLATANDATGDLRSVQTFARHKRPETTAGYTRTTGRRLVAVMESLDY